MGSQSRRRFLRGSLALTGLGLLAGCGIPVSPATPPARVRRIGWLVSGTLATNMRSQEAFRQGMGELGYVEGQHFALEVRSAEGRLEPLLELAAEFHFIINLNAARASGLSIPQSVLVQATEIIQ
jgi:hypothetical protein